MGLAETIAELNRKLNRVTKEQTPEPTDSVGWRNLYIKGFPIETTYSHNVNDDPIFNWCIKLGEKYPNDIGVLSPLLLLHLLVWFLFQFHLLKNLYLHLYCQ